MRHGAAECDMVDAIAIGGGCEPAERAVRREHPACALVVLLPLLYRRAGSPRDRGAQLVLETRSETIDLESSILLRSTSVHDKRHVQFHDKRYLRLHRDFRLYTREDYTHTATPPPTAVSAVWPRVLWSSRESPPPMCHGPTPRTQGHADAPRPTARPLDRCLMRLPTVSSGVAHERTRRTARA